MFGITWPQIIVVLSALIIEVTVMYSDSTELLGQTDQSATLPKNTTPLRYDIHIQTWIHLDDDKFTGNTVIKVRAESNTKQIVLQSRSQIITEIQLFDSEKVEITVQNHVLDNNDLKINLATQLVAGKEYDLEINYTSTLQANNIGFYRSSYLADDGSLKTLAATEFEPTSASHAFPCFDEPNYRTPFGLKITHGRSHTALSNMPVVGSAPAADASFMTTTFQDTPAMSTHLVAFVISDFEFIESSKYNLTQRVYARPNGIQFAHFGLEACVEILNALKEYTQVNYSLPKMDLVAIPDRTGAMENWGLMTFVENLLLFNPDMNTFRHKFWIVAAVAQAMAHQWFGELLTPKSWDYNWMKEGLAHIVGYIAADLVYPEMKLMDLYSLDTVQKSFHADVLQSSNAMSSKGGAPSVITSEKSGSVLRMIQHTIGATTFQKGLRYYLKDMALKTAEPEDLNRNLEIAIHEDDAIPEGLRISDIMDSWTLQKGYPIVTVTRQKNGNILISQTSFALNAFDRTDALFYIPYNFASASVPDFESTSPDGWITPNESSVEIFPTATKTWSPIDWVILNIQQTGYYRVNYDTEGWYLIIYQLLYGDHNKIHYINRAQLVDDALILARVKQLSYSITFNLLRYLKKETEYLPWAAADKGLTHLYQSLSGTTHYVLFKRFIGELVEHLYSALGIDDVAGESILNKYARVLAIKWACLVELEDCRSKTFQSLSRQVDGGNILPDTKEAIYCNGLRDGGQKEFLYLNERFKDTSDQSERQLIIDSMGCSENATFLRDLLKATIDPDKDHFRFHDKSKLLISVYSGSSIGLMKTIEFLQENYIAANSSGINLNLVTEGMASRTFTKELTDKFNTYLEQVQSSITAETYNYAKKIVNDHVAWSKSVDSDKISYLLVKHYQRFLTNTTYPINYDLHITTTVHTGERMFTGNVVIEIVMEQPSREIILHSRNHIIQNLTISTVAGVKIPHLDVVADPETGKLIILFFQELPPAIYFLEIDYTSELEKDLKGFYRAEYSADDGSARYLATTHFEATDARRALPCFDEFSFRAVFNVRITHDASYMALSNMPVISVEPGPGNMVTTFFENTPKMPSYLLAFIVSEYVSIQGNKYGLPQRVFARPNAIHLAQFGLDAGIEILHVLEEYFRVPYVLPKLDQVAIRDLESSAMENWGLVTYRESDLLFDPSSGPFDQMIYIASIIAHEYSHQWFGNLVTPKYVDFTWLKEGFACLFGYFGADLVYKEYKMMDLFLIKNLYSVFETDAEPTTQAMTTVNGTEIVITYSKSGSVIRMWQHAFGLSTFQKGLHYFLIEKSSAEPDDLTRNMAYAVEEDNSIPCNLNVSAIMNSWTLQKGYPVVNVRRDLNGSIEFEQKHFVLNAEDETNASFFIPINFATASNRNFENTAPMGWIPRGIKSMLVKPTPEINWLTNDWVIVNKMQTGYYRVNYDERGWDLIITELVKGDHNKIHYTNRAQLVNDALALAKANQLDYGTVFDLLIYLKHEREHLPWAAANSGLYDLNILLEGTTYHKLFKAFVGMIIEDLYDYLGVDEVANESIPDKYARLVVIKWACRIGFHDCRSTMRGKLTNALNGGLIPPNLKPAIYCDGLYDGDREEFMFLWNRMQEIQDQSERDLIIGGLSCSVNPKFLRELLDSLVDENNKNYTEDEKLSIIQSVYTKNAVSLVQTIEFLKVSHEDTLKFGADMNDVVSGIAKLIATPEQAGTFRELLQILKPSLSKETFKDAEEIMTKNLAWKTSDQSKSIKKWLEDFFFVSTPPTDSSPSTEATDNFQ